ESFFRRAARDRGHKSNSSRAYTTKRTSTRGSYAWPRFYAPAIINESRMDL
ncbi:unnamed protein product, partial [Didymodactylos carnosus]